MSAQGSEFDTAMQALIKRIVKARIDEPQRTAAQVHEALLKDGGADATLPEVKRASGKLNKFLANRGCTLEEYYFEDLVGHTGAVAIVKSAAEGKRVVVDGELANAVAAEMHGKTIVEQYKMPLDERNAYSKQLLDRLAQNGVKMEAAQKGFAQLEEAKRTGVAPGRAERVVGFIAGNEPPEERARMWVDLLLCPSGKAALMGQPAWMNEQMGMAALMKGSNADSLECMCCWLGLADMIASGQSDDHQAVVRALGERGDETASALLQMIVHQPVGQDFMYGGHWKRPSKSPVSLPASPMLYTKPAVWIMDSLLRVLKFMADHKTYVIYASKELAEYNKFITKGLLCSPHLPKAVARLVQVIGQRRVTARLGDGDARLQDAIGKLPEYATWALHALVRLAPGGDDEPPFRDALRAHPRAREVLAETLDDLRSEGQAQDGAFAQQIGQLLHVSHCGAPVERERPTVGKGVCEACGATSQHALEIKEKAIAYCGAVCKRAAKRLEKRAQKRKEKLGQQQGDENEPVQAPDVSQNEARLGTSDPPEPPVEEPMNEQERDLINKILGFTV